MRSTRLGTLLLATGWACFLVALVLQTLAPAILGVVLLALVSGRRLPAPSLNARRIVPARPVEGVPLTVVTEVDGPADMPIIVHDVVPPGAMVHARTAETRRGIGRETLTFQAARPGVLTWQHVRVRYQDSWGLLEDEVSIPLSDHIAVLPDAVHASTRARVDGALTEGGRLRRLLAVDTEPEVERLRDWQQGDRLRDIDWAHSALLDKLISREMAHASILPVVLMIHAGATMRRERYHSKMATAVHAALGIAGAAQKARLPIGFLAWTDAGVEMVVPAASGRKLITRALLHLATLPGSHVWQRTAHSESSPKSTPPTQQERAFLEAASSFVGNSPGPLTSLEASLSALTRVTPQPSVVFLFADLEEVPDLAEVMVRRLKTRGHRPVVVALASGAHHYRLQEIDTDAAQQLVKWRSHREEARRACMRHRVPFIVLGPHVEAKTIQEVIRSAA